MNRSLSLSLFLSFSDVTFPAWRVSFLQLPLDNPQMQIQSVPLTNAPSAPGRLDAFTRHDTSAALRVIPSSSFSVALSKRSPYFRRAKFSSMHRAGKLAAFATRFDEFSLSVHFFPKRFRLPDRIVVRIYDRGAECVASAMRSAADAHLPEIDCEQPRRFFIPAARHTLARSLARSRSAIAKRIFLSFSPPPLPLPYPPGMHAGPRDFDNRAASPAPSPHSSRAGISIRFARRLWDEETSLRRSVW